MKIWKSAYLTDNLSLDIFYGNDLQRVKQVFYNNQEMLEKKLYISGLYEETEDGEGNVSKLHYLAGSNGMFGIHVKDNINGDNTYYILSDHLGSYNVITDETGVKLSEGGELSFDAWGKRRNPTTWQTYQTTPSSSIFDRGFTGHEHLDDFGLIMSFNKIIISNSTFDWWATFLSKANLVCFSTKLTILFKVLLVFSSTLK